MAYSERINTRLVQLAAVTNTKFNKKPLRDLVGRLQKPRYALSPREADWLNKTCKIWLGATTGFAAGYTMTDRQRQTLRANFGKITGTPAGAATSNVTPNVGSAPANVTLNVGSAPSNVRINVGPVALKAAQELGFASLIVNNVIDNSQNSRYVTLDLPPPGVAPVADVQAGHCAAGAVLSDPVDGSAEFDAGSAARRLDPLDVAHATAVLTSASAAASPTKLTDNADHPTDQEDHRSKGPGIMSGQAGQGGGPAAGANIGIEQALRLGAFKTIRMSLWTDRHPLGKGEIHFGTHKLMINFEPAANGAQFLGRVATDQAWEKAAGDMLVDAARHGGAVSGLYMGSYSNPMENACVVLLYENGVPSHAILDVAAWKNDLTTLSLERKPVNSKGPQFKGEFKVA
ncbi:hypothetical protein ACM64Y_14475 [Novispirillum sp. DQ9]|uniref:hypothetical protein n=1 Tax=Novispirillum sp. DQ9 TaxID=3398612 RepID=UPI003C7D920F